MAQKSFRTAVLLKMEATYGVDPVPAGATDAVLIRSATITPLDAQTEDRTVVKPYFGADEKLIVGQTVKIDYEVELAGSGALGTVPAWGPSARVCGLAQTVNAGVSVTYGAPVSLGAESGAYYFHKDGILHKALGARGSQKIVLKAGGVPVIQYSVMSLYTGPADIGFPAQTFTPWIKPVPVNNANTVAFSMHSYAGILTDLSIDIATKPTYKNLVGAERVDLEDSAITGQITVEMPAVATKDFIGICKSGALGIFTITHGTVVGNRVRLDSGAVQLLNPLYDDSSGDVRLSMDMVLVQRITGELSFLMTVT